MPATLAHARHAGELRRVPAGRGETYEASTTANVISTAGDAALTVSDPGHLTNGAFSLPRAAAGRASARRPGRRRCPTTPVTITFKQRIKANDPLRTGTYSQTLTFTLSTTTP